MPDGVDIKEQLSCSYSMKSSTIEGESSLSDYNSFFVDITGVIGPVSLGANVGLEFETKTL